MFKYWKILLIISNFIYSQDDKWSLKSIQSNCPDIGAEETCEGTPFSEFTIRGKRGQKEDDERWWWVSDNSLGLSNYDKGSNKSGSFKIIVRNDEEILLDNSTFVKRSYNVKIKFQFETKGSRKFLDNIFPKISSDFEGIIEKGEDYFIAELIGGDELSVDLDNEWSRIPSFKLKSKGRIIVESDNKEDSIDDESILTLLDVSAHDKVLNYIPNSYLRELDDLIKKRNLYETSWNTKYQNGMVGPHSDQNNPPGNAAINYFNYNQSIDASRIDEFWQRIELQRKIPSRDRIPHPKENFSKEELIEYIELRFAFLYFKQAVELMEKPIIAIKQEEKRAMLAIKQEEERAMLAIKQEEERKKFLDIKRHLLTTIFNEEKKGVDSNEKSFPIYKYTINDQTLFTRVNIPNSKLNEQYTGSNSIDFNNGIAFWVLNEPGRAIFRKAYNKKEERLELAAFIENDNNYIKYSENSGKNYDNEKVFDILDPNEVAKYRALWDAKPFPSLIGKALWDVKPFPSLIDGYRDTQSWVFSSEESASSFLIFRETVKKEEKKKKIAELNSKKNRHIESVVDLKSRILHLLENPNDIQKLGDPAKSKFIISELNVLEKKVKDRISSIIFDQEYFETEVATGEPDRINEKCYEMMTAGKRATVQSVLFAKNLCTETPYRIVEGYRNKSYPVNPNISIQIKKPTWNEIVEYYGGYSGVAENNIVEEDFKMGAFDLRQDIKSVEFLNLTGDCLINVAFYGNLKYHGISNESDTYKGRYTFREPKNYLYSLFVNPKNNLKFDINFLKPLDLNEKIIEFELSVDLNDEIVNNYKDAVSILIKNEVSKESFKSIPSIKRLIEEINIQYEN